MRPTLTRNARVLLTLATVVALLLATSACDDSTDSAELSSDTVANAGDAMTPDVEMSGDTDDDAQTPGAGADTTLLDVADGMSATDVSDVVLTDTDHSDIEDESDIDVEPDTGEASDTEASDTDASDTEASDTEASDTDASDTEASDTEASDTEASDTGDAGPDVEEDTFVTPTIGTQDNPAVDCLEIVQEWPGAPSGAYYLALTSGTYAAYCDMEIYGGGWTMVSNRPYAPVPGAWGAFSTPPVGPASPQVETVLPFLDLTTVPKDVILMLEGLDDVLIQPVAANAQWEILSLGARLPLADGRYLIFADQPAAINQAVCLAPGTFDTGFKCDGNGQLEHVQGMLSAFAEDEVCNCDTHGYKTHVAGCEVAVCAPEGLAAVFLR